MLGFDQLIAEAYLKGQVGSGTYVNESMPDDLLAPFHDAANESATTTSRGAIAVRAHRKPQFGPTPDVVAPDGSS